MAAHSAPEACHPTVVLIDALIGDIRVSRVTMEATRIHARGPTAAKADSLRSTPAGAIWEALPVPDQHLLLWLLSADIVTAPLAALLVYGHLRTAQRRLARLAELGDPPKLLGCQHAPAAGAARTCWAGRLGSMSSGSCRAAARSAFAMYSTRSPTSWSWPTRPRLSEPLQRDLQERRAWNGGRGSGPATGSTVRCSNWLRGKELRSQRRPG